MLRSTRSRTLAWFVAVLVSIFGVVLAPAAQADPSNAVIGNLSAQPGDGTAALSFYTFDPNTVSYQYSLNSGATWQDGDFQLDASFNYAYTVTGLTNGTSYDITVRGLGSGGEAEAGPVSNVATVVPGTPAAPGGVNASPVKSQTIALTFTQPANGGFPITGYDVSAQTTDPPIFRAVTAQELSVDEFGNVTITLTGLTNRASYIINVRARNANGAGSAATAFVTPDAEPNPPRNVQAVAGDGQASVTFAPPAPTPDGGSAPVDGTYTAVADPGGVSTSGCFAGSPCVVTGLTNGVSYTFTMTVSNGPLTSAPSQPSNVVVPFNVPLAPTGLALVGRTATTLSVSFVPADPNGRPITRYEYSLNGAAWIAFTPRRQGNRLVLALTGVQPGANTRVAIRAVNIGGPGASGSITVLTVPAALGRPSARAGMSGAVVRWSAARSASVTGYTVYARPGNARCTTEDRLQTSCLIGLTAGTPTSFIVVARNAAGASVASVSSNVVRASSPYVPRDLPAVPRALSTPGHTITKVKGGQRFTLAGAGFMPNSSVTVVVYGGKRAILRHLVSNSRGVAQGVVRVPKGKARRLTFVAFGITDSGTPKAMSKSLRRR